jgi:hypothetical protein
MRAALPGSAGFVTIEEAGHWPQLETPDRVNVALLAFPSEIADCAKHYRRFRLTGRLLVVSSIGSQA